MRLHLFLSPAVVLFAVSAAARGDGADDYLAQARRALMNNDGERALELAGKAVAADPRDARAYLLRGAAHELLRHYAEAVADFTRCLERDPKSAEALDRRGSEQFKLGRIRESLDDFDAALKLRPREAPGHWKRGISLYYLGRYADGRQQFKDGEKVFGNDVENAVWHFLCNARLVGVEKARAEMLRVGRDARVPMPEVYDLFVGKGKPADVLAAARAGDAPAELRKTQLFYAHLYLGLYHDAAGDRDKAREHLRLAAGRYRVAHYMGDVARIHLSLLERKEKK